MHSFILNAIIKKKDTKKGSAHLTEILWVRVNISVLRVGHFHEYHYR